MKNNDTENTELSYRRPNSYTREFWLSDPNQVYGSWNIIRTRVMELQK